MLGPLLTRPDVDFVKGYFRRPTVRGEGGGRVTELVARPLLSMYFPELAQLIQPLGGEYGGRRQVLEALPFSVGYGVDVGLLLDLHQRTGISGLCQCDLGVRRHRNRSLMELGPQATEVAAEILSRIDATKLASPISLIRPDQEPHPIPSERLPPMATLEEYWIRHQTEVIAQEPRDSSQSSEEELDAC